MREYNRGRVSVRGLRQCRICRYP